MVTSTHTRRLAAGLTAGGLLLLPLAACSDSATPDGSTTAESPAATTSASAPEEETSEPAEESATAGETGATDGSGATGAAPTESGVDCAGTSCSVTLAGDGAEVDVFGTTMSLGNVQDGRATLGVAGNEVSCSQGETLSAGPLQVECTTVTPDGVTLTASLG